MGWLSREDSEVERKLDDIEDKLDDINGKIYLLSRDIAHMGGQLVDILNILSAPPPTGFVVTETSTSQIQGVTQMATMQVDFQLLENGTAKLTAATVPVGSVLPAGVIPTWASSDPVSLPVEQDLVNDPTGMTAIATGKAVVVGVIPSISAILPTGTISGQGNPIDVSIGGPTGFTVTEQ